MLDTTGNRKQEIKPAWAICPVDGCDFALERDEEDSFFCPSCEVEMLTACPSCRARITAESQTRSLGYSAMPRVFTPHPIQDRTDDEMRAYADAAFDEIVAAVTAG